MGRTAKWVSGGRLVKIAFIAAQSIDSLLRPKHCEKIFQKNYLMIVRKREKRVGCCPKANVIMTAQCLLSCLPRMVWWRNWARSHHASHTTDRLCLGKEVHHHVDEWAIELNGCLGLELFHNNYKLMGWSYVTWQIMERLKIRIKLPVMYWLELFSFLGRLINFPNLLASSRKLFSSSINS